MRISHSKKFLYIAIPKTASTSIRVALDPFSDVRGLRSPCSALGPHATALMLQEYFRDKELKWGEYFKFCFVRNPWQRVVSQYFSVLRIAQEKAGTPAWQEQCLKIISECSNFSEFVKKEYIKNPNEMWRYFQDRDGKTIVDFVGRFENLEEDFQIICDKIDLPNIKLSHLQPNQIVINKPNHGPYRDYYTPELVKLVAEFHMKDIGLFGYKF